MSEIANLKRQIVSQTVDENVALIEGTRLEMIRERRRSKWLAWRRAAFALLLAVAGTSVLLSRPWDGHAPTAESSALVASEGDESEAPAQRPTRWPGEPPDLLRETPLDVDPSIFPLQVRHIVLDPGHGGEDLGTRNGELYEKDLTLDIALRLRDLLIEKGFEVSMTRESDEAVVLRERRDFANEIDADVFVSIHLNWIVNRATRGVETYYLGPTEDPELNALARRENAHSGYTLVEQSDLVRGMVLNAQHVRSRQLAGQIQQTLFRSLRDVNPALKDRGVKTAPFVVLIGTEMPAILAEVSCLSNDEEVEMLSRPLYRGHIAEALLKGVLRYARTVDSSVADSLGP